MCEAKEEVCLYHPRKPKQSPFYRLVERFYPEGFETVYTERYQERYGFWRPIIGTVVRKFLECGDPPSLSELRRGKPRSRLCPGKVPEVPARVVRGVLLSRSVLLPELP